jgi:hypothetical protein
VKRAVSFLISSLVFSLGVDDFSPKWLRPTKGVVSLTPPFDETRLKCGEDREMCNLARPLLFRTSSILNLSFSPFRGYPVGHFAGITKPASSNGHCNGMMGRSYMQYFENIEKIFILKRYIICCILMYMYEYNTYQFQVKDV